MIKVEWKKEYNTGIAIIDEQHRNLFGLVKRLQKLARQDNHREALYEALGELAKYAREHFAEEEKRMLACGYAGYQEHLEEHQYFAKKVEMFLVEFLKGDKALAKVLLDFMENWLLTHVVIMDMKYVPCLTAQK